MDVNQDAESLKKELDELEELERAYLKGTLGEREIEDLGNRVGSDYLGRLQLAKEAYDECLSSKWANELRDKALVSLQGLKTESNENVAGMAGIAEKALGWLSLPDALRNAMQILERELRFPVEAVRSHYSPVTFDASEGVKGIAREGDKGGSEITVTIFGAMAEHVSRQSEAPRLLVRYLDSDEKPLPDCDEIAVFEKRGDDFVARGTIKPNQVEGATTGVVLIDFS